MKLLFLDCETGGLDEQETSLLSVGMTVWEDSNIKNVFEIYVKEPVLRVTSKSLAINKIDLRKFDQIAVPVDEAWIKIKQFIYRNFGLNKDKFKMAGMNPTFDIRFMKQCFGKEHIEKWFSHKTIDIQAIITYLYNKGNLSEDCASSEKSYKYFNINNGIVDHMALKDCLNEIKIYEVLLKMDLSKGSVIDSLTYYSRTSIVE